MTKIKYNTNYCFAVDKMLGTLAKWLRILGYDTFYHHHITNAKLLKIARKDKRIIITKSRYFHKIYTKVPIIFVHQDKLKLQMRELHSELNLTDQALFTRCVICNTLTKSIDKHTIKNLVPPYIYKTHNAFYHCIICGKVYWQGTHYEQAKEFFKEIIK